MKYKALLFVVSIAAFYACTSSSSPEMKRGNSSYELDTISPAQALSGTHVVLYGKNFPDTTAKVYFGDVPADSILVISLSSIEVVVPQLENSQVQVRVSSIDDKYYSNTRPFTVPAVPQKVRPVYFATHTISKGWITPKGRLEIKELFEDAHPRGLKVDHKTNTAYWGNFYGYLQKYNLDSMKHDIILSVGEGLLDVAWDYDYQNAYICKEDKIIRKNLIDTTKTEVLFKNRQEPFGIALSKDGEHLYWIEWDALTIYVASVSGGEPEKFLSIEDGLYGPRAFAIDEANDKVYIADVPKVGDASIVEYDLKSKSLKRVLNSKKGAGTLITDIAIDDQNGYLYWMNSKGRNHNHLDDGEILRAPLNDLSKPEVIIQPINWGNLLAF